MTTSSTPSAAHTRELQRLQALEEELREQRGELEVSRARFAMERERYRELFHLAPIGYCVTDARGVVREANETLGSMFGLDPEALVGTSLATYVAQEHRRNFRRRLLRLAADEPEQSWEVALRVRRERLWGELTVARARTAIQAGDLLWAVRDVTARRAAEEDARRLARELEERVRERTADLERERAQLEAVIRQMPAGIAIAEAPSGRILLANRRAAALVRRRSASAVHADGRPFAADELPLSRALRGETVEGVRMRYPKGDDEATIVEASAVPVRTRGRTVAAVAIFVDVTERERAQRAMRDFVTNAAHELQTPLSAIVSATDVLQSGAKDDPRDRDRFLAHVEEQCARLTRLLRALLVLARAQSGAEAPHAGVLPLRPLLEDAAAEVAPSAAVPVEVACEPDVAVVANRELLRQAILNLVANAANHTESGRIELSARADGDDVVVEVRDTGRGIAADQLERVFDRFYRASEERREGFGLGLAIVREVASALDGEVVIESEVGVGTAVQLTLPGVALVEP